MVEQSHLANVLLSGHDVKITRLELDGETLTLELTARVDAATLQNAGTSAATEPTGPSRHGEPDTDIEWAPHSDNPPDPGHSETASATDLLKSVGAPDNAIMDTTEDDSPARETTHQDSPASATTLLKGADTARLFKHQTDAAATTPPPEPYTPEEEPEEDLTDDNAFMQSSERHRRLGVTGEIGNPQPVPESSQAGESTTSAAIEASTPDTRQAEPDGTTATPPNDPPATPATVEKTPEPAAPQTAPELTPPAAENVPSHVSDTTESDKHPHSNESADDSPPAEEISNGEMQRVRFKCPSCATVGSQTISALNSIVTCAQCGQAMKLSMKK